MVIYDTVFGMPSKHPSVNSWERPILCNRIYTPFEMEQKRRHCQLYSNVRRIDRTSRESSRYLVAFDYIPNWRNAKKENPLSSILWNGRKRNLTQTQKDRQHRCASGHSPLGASHFPKMFITLLLIQPSSQSAQVKFGNFSTICMCLVSKHHSSPLGLLRSHIYKYKQGKTRECQLNNQTWNAMVSWRKYSFRTNAVRTSCWVSSLYCIQLWTDKYTFIHLFKIGIYFISFVNVIQFVFICGHYF